MVADEGVLLKGAGGTPFPRASGDLVAKIAAGLDWLATASLGIEPVDPGVWRMVQPRARARLPPRPGGPAPRDPAAVKELYLGLLASGLRDAALRPDSRPASGTEHLLSHVWEMDELEFEGKPVFHGFKVTLGTLVSNAFMRGAFFPFEGRPRGAAWREQPGPRGRTARGGGTAPRGNALSPQDGKTYPREDTPGKKDLAERRRKILEVWTPMKKRILDRLPDYEELKSVFSVAGCPTEPADIGLSRGGVERGLFVAQLIRKRYTVLDLAAELGLLDSLVRKVASGGYFSRFQPEPRKRAR